MAEISEIALSHLKTQATKGIYTNPDTTLKLIRQLEEAWQRIAGLEKESPTTQIRDEADIGQLAQVTNALDTCIAALTQIIEKHGKDWIQREVIFGSKEFNLAMNALKEACTALGYTLRFVHRGEEKL